jgi:DivIVA domain-containing protein
MQSWGASMSAAVQAGHVSRHSAELTAEEARNTTFPPSAIGWRGYSEEEVNDFVYRAAQALAAAEHECSALRAEIHRLRNFYREQGTDIDNAVERPPSRSHRRNGHLVGEVERYAEKHLALATTYAEGIIDDDRGKAEAHLYHARLRGRAVVDDMLGTFLSNPHNRSRAEAELRRLVCWLRAFGEAVWTQSDAMAQVAEEELESLTALR